MYPQSPENLPLGPIIEIPPPPSSATLGPLGTLIHTMAPPVTVLLEHRVDTVPSELEGGHHFPRKNLTSSHTSWPPLPSWVLPLKCLCYRFSSVREAQGCSGMKEIKC
jgi:hypothetical protein